MTTKDNSIEQLRKFFRISNAAFEFVNVISKTFDVEPTQNKMQVLHKLALNELEKKNPNLMQVDYLLAEMEHLAGSNARKSSQV